MTLSQRLGSVVHASRVVIGLSQSELGRKSGMEASAICHLESGRRSPSITTLFKVAAGLGMKPSVLISRIEQEPAK